jgi:hypothetical protein
MWKPFRSNTIVGGVRNGYSINSADGSRFPAGGGFAVYHDPSYENLFEAITQDASEADTTDITTLDFLPKKRGTWSGFNYVEHYKRSTVLSSGAGSHDTWINPSNHAQGVWHNVNIPVINYWTENLLGTSIDPNTVFGPIEIPILGSLPFLWEGPLGVYKGTGGLEGTALRAMLPGIRPATSLINSIYELKDLTTIPHTLAKIKSALNNVEALINLKGFSRSNGFGGKTLKSLSQAGADVYLQKRFNVSPMLQDIVNVAGSVDKVRGKLNQLISSANRPITRHWSRDLDGFGDRDDIINDTGSYGPVVNVSYRRIVGHPQKRFSATLEYSYRMPEGSYQDLLVKGIKDYNGLVLSPQVIWNAIPFSFVVDWIVGIGPWLSQFTGRELEVVTHISKFGYSVHIERVITQYHSHVGQVSQLTEESYYRTPASGVGTLISSLQTSGLNPDEFSLASGMFLSKHH